MKTKEEIMNQVAQKMDEEKIPIGTTRIAHLTSECMQIYSDQQLEAYKAKLKEAIEEKQMVHWSSQAYNGMQVAKDLIDTV